MSPSVRPGDPAPDFTLPSTTGEPFTLSRLKGQRNVVLYFYPKDRTPGCTREAQSFRDQLDAFRAMEADVVGVSRDDLESHRRFAAQCQVSFPLLSDKGGAVAKTYGAIGFLGLTTKRITFVIDKQGIVQHIHASMMPSGHISEALEALRRLSKKS